MTQPEYEKPISELYRLAALKWVDLDAAARMYEESRSAVLAQRVTALAPMPVSRAEAAVKASQEWEDYTQRMVEARTKANEAKVEVEFYKMRHMENVSVEANARLERKSG